MRHTMGRRRLGGRLSGKKKYAATPPTAQMPADRRKDICGVPVAVIMTTDRGTPTAKPPPTASPKYKPKLGPMLLLLLTSEMYPCEAEYAVLVEPSTRMAMYSGHSTGEKARQKCSRLVPNADISRHTLRP